MQSQNIDFSQGQYDIVDPARSHRPIRQLGQNFLQDSALASQITNLAKLEPGDTVLEPGAGYGFLTEHLRRSAGRVIAVEKDRRLVSYLKDRFAGDQKVQVIEGDVLRTPLPTFNRIVGTPPYNISSKLVLFLLSSTFESAHLVFQEEFGNRLRAEAGTENYGRLSITAQRKLLIEPLLRISRSAFTPRPKVDSILLSLKPRATEGTRLNEALFHDLVRGLFVQRRRLLKGALTHYLGLKMGKSPARTMVSKLVLPGVRVYQMSIPQFEDLSRQLEGLPL